MEFRRPFTGPQAGYARRVADQALRVWKVRDPNGDVLLVVTELVENVAQHTEGGGLLRLSLRPGVVLIQVSDTSRELPTLHPPAPGQQLGRGLWIVQTVARAWGARPVPRGKVVWAELAPPLT
jgi:signal transduction histidine kinase